MNSKHTISSVDFSRLMSLMASFASHSAAASPNELDEKLANASVVPPEEIRPNLVTMNSKVLLRSPAWDGVREYRLVYPLAQDCSPGELSVFSALGANLLAARTGARFSLGSGPSSRTVEVVALSYQPEAAGHWNL